MSKLLTAKEAYEISMDSQKRSYKKQLKDCLKSILKFSKDGRTTILFLDLYKQTVEHLKSLGYIIEIEYEKDDRIYNVSWEDSMEVCKIDA